MTDLWSDPGIELVTPVYSPEGSDESILVNLSGRGDKDLGTVADLAGADFYDRPSMRGLQVKGGKS